jgi:two-component sensor histidine kinase/PAS domain-containing protein
MEDLPSILREVSRVMPGTFIAVCDMPRDAHQWESTIRVAETETPAGVAPPPRRVLGKPVAEHARPRLRHWFERLCSGERLDLPEDRTDEETLRAIGLTAYIAMPIDTGLAQLNVVTLGTTLPSRRWSPLERAVLESLASMVASALRREHHLEELGNSEHRFRLLIEDMPSGVALFERDGTLALHNSSLLRLLELEDGETLRLDDAAWQASDDAGAAFHFARRILDPVFQDAVRVRSVLCCITTRVTATRLWVMISADPVLDSAGAVRHALVVLTDVTERRLAEGRLQSSLREKELLLQEVFHRVKNNLQTVSTLLRMQARACPNPDAARAIDSAHARVLAMALVHEQLHAAGSLRGMDLADTVRRIGRAAAGMLRDDRESVRLEVEGDSVSAGVTQTMLFGLIVNELLTNAFKHAFGTDGRGRVTVRIKGSKDVLRLEVEDDGRGPPPGFSADATSGLGLRIVRLLVQQMRGTLDIQHTPGFRATVTAPHTSP